MKSTICFILSLSLAIPVRAADTGSGYVTQDDVSNASRGTEFTSGSKGGDVLMRVNLWGAVNKSGIHYVPVHTDLLTLLSYAGGPVSAAELDQVTIKRRAKGKETVMEIDLEDLLESDGVENPILEANDIVVVPAQEQYVSSNTMILLTAIGTVLTIALTSIVLSDRLSQGK